jgi:hypothetical protein
MGALLLFLIWTGLGGAMGYPIGRSKGRGALSFWFGLLLGVIGLVIVAIISPTPEFEAREFTPLLTSDQCRLRWDPCHARGGIVNAHAPASGTMHRD